jgi:hypothetical protein
VLLGPMIARIRPDRFMPSSLSSLEVLDTMRMLCVLRLETDLYSGPRTPATPFLRFTSDLELSESETVSRACFFSLAPLSLRAKSDPLSSLSRGLLNLFGGREATLLLREAAS